MWCLSLSYFPVLFITHSWLFPNWIYKQCLHVSVSRLFVEDTGSQKDVLTRHALAYQQNITCLLQLRDQNQTPNHQHLVVLFTSSSSILHHSLFSPSCLLTCLPSLSYNCPIFSSWCWIMTCRVCSFMCIYFRRLTPPTVSEDHPTAVFFPTSSFCQFLLL